MNRQMYRVIGGIVAVVLVIGAAAFGYIYVSGGSGQASAPISAPAVSANNTSGSTSSTQKVYAIDPAQSKVTFTLTEDLMGKPNTVVATTHQVAGNVLIDLNSP